MGYLDKIHKKAQMDKIVKDIMKSPQYRQAVKKDQEQAAMRAYCNFCLIACDYLEEHENYGSKRLRRFLEFAVKRMHYLADDNENYYQEMNGYFIKRFGVNVFESMGVEIVKEGADNGQLANNN